MNNETLTKCSSNKGLADNSSILPHSNFGGGRQDSSPQSATGHIVNRWQ